MIKFEIGDMHQSEAHWYLHAYLQADTIAELVAIRKNACGSNGSVIYKVDYSKSKKVRPSYGMTQRLVTMPRVIEKIGDYFEQPSYQAPVEVLIDAKADSGQLPVANIANGALL